MNNLLLEVHHWPDCMCWRDPAVVSTPLDSVHGWNGDVMLMLLDPIEPSTLLNHVGNLDSLVQFLPCRKEVGNTIQDNMNSLLAVS